MRRFSSRFSMLCFHFDSALFYSILGRRGDAGADARVRLRLLPIQRRMPLSAGGGAARGRVWGQLDGVLMRSSNRGVRLCARSVCRSSCVFWVLFCETCSVPPAGSAGAPTRRAPSQFWKSHLAPLQGVVETGVPANVLTVTTRPKAKRKHVKRSHIRLCRVTSHECRVCV